MKPIFGRLPKFLQLDAYPPWYFGEGREDFEFAGFGGLIHGSTHDRSPASDGGPTVSTADIATSALPTDPFFGYQWHLLNTGQDGGTAGVDINVVGVWDDYTGYGVTIGVVDTGIEYTHPDLVDGVNTAIDHDALDGDDDVSAGPGENHATTVTGTIVATERRRRRSSCTRW